MTRLFACCLALSLAPSLARADRTLPIVVHVAERAGKPVADAQFIADRIARTNEIYAPYQIRFEVLAERPLAETHARMETRADRDALGAEVSRGAIDCFIVESLRDVDEPDRVRRGVHWHSQTHPGAHFVILSIIGGLDVLAHELGHFLGNPKHSEVAGNLMSYEHTEVLPFLDEAQQLNVRRALAGYLKRGELKLVR
ncbi:MAG TPA: hypothetical protein VHZ95_18715 [Polyangiales bacterium]|nr:hypothetical protein [Polyangiales bacterium]